MESKRFGLKFMMKKMMSFQAPVKSKEEDGNDLSGAEWSPVEWRGRIWS